LTSRDSVVDFRDTVCVTCQNENTYYVTFKIPRKSKCNYIKLVKIHRVNNIAFFDG